MVSPLLPLLLSAAYFGDIDRPSSRLLDQNFGLGLRPEQLLLPRYEYYVPRDRLLDVYFRPWADLLRPEGGGTSSITLNKDKFQIILDIQQFKPEEIEVKVADKYIIVSAKHEEKKDEHGLVSRQFMRRYAIPENVLPDTIKSEISSDGILAIQAQVKEVPEDENVRKIKIEYTGKPALKPKEQGPEEATESTADVKSNTESSTSATEK